MTPDYAASIGAMEATGDFKTRFAQPQWLAALGHAHSALMGVYGLGRRAIYPAARGYRCRTRTAHLLKAFIKTLSGWG